jgi:hypothetical protein
MYYHPVFHVNSCDFAQGSKAITLVNFKYPEETWLIMMTTKSILSVTILTCIFLLIVPSSAAINTVLPSGTVFIGEQGLDITAAMEGDTQIGWWASGAGITTSSPDSKIMVSNPTSFFVTPTDFGTHQGAWYHLNPAGVANGSAFVVADPRLEIRVEDTTVNVDVTNKWVPTDDEIQFRIDTNLLPISQRGTGSVPITIKVKAPDGGMYSALMNKAGNAVSLDQAVTTTPFYTGAIWNTGNRATYAPGTYTIWAECNVNSMKDNYGITGKTISSQVSLLNQDHNPIIRVYSPTTTIIPVTTKAATTSSTTVIATIPSPTTESTVKVTTAEVSQTEPVTPVPVTTTQIPPTTKSPGFEGILVSIAISLALLLGMRKN